MTTSEEKFLEKTEKSVYAALLAKWPQTIAEITFMTNLSEQEVESTINSLISKDLVEKLDYDVDLFIGRSIIPQFQAKAVVFLDDTILELTKSKEELLNGKVTVDKNIKGLQNSLKEFNNLIAETISENENFLLSNLKDSSLETLDTLNQDVDKIAQLNLTKIGESKEKYNLLLTENTERLNNKVNEILVQVEEWSNSVQNRDYIEDFNNKIIKTNEAITNEAKKLEKTFREQYNLLEENIVRIIKQSTTESIRLTEETNEDFREGIIKVQDDFNSYLNIVKSDGFEKIQQDIFEGINTLVSESTILFTQSITKNQKSVVEILEKKFTESEKLINTSVEELLSKSTIAINNTTDNLRKQEKDIKNSISKVPSILKSLEGELSNIQTTHSKDLLHELEDYQSNIRNQIKAISKDIISIEKQNNTNFNKTLKEIVLEFQKINSEIVGILERNSETAIIKSETVNKALIDSKDNLIRQSNMFAKDITENIFVIADPLKAKIKDFNTKKLPKIREELLLSAEKQKSTITELKNTNTDIIEDQLVEVEKIELSSDVTRKELIDDIRKRLETMVKEIGRNFDEIGSKFETKVIDINNKVESIFTDLTSKLKTSWKNSKELIDKEQKNQKELISKNINEYSRNLNSNLQNINSSIATELDNTLSIIESEFIKVKGQIKKDIDENSETINTSFISIQKELSDYLSGFSTTTENFYENNFSDFENTTKTTIEDLMSYINEERDGITQIYDDKESELFSVTEKTVNEVVSYFGNINATITEVSNKLRSILINLSSNTKKAANDLSVISTGNMTLVKNANKALNEETSKILEDLSNLRSNIDLKLNEIQQSCEKNLVSDFDNAITQIKGLSTDIVISSDLENKRIKEFTKTQIETINTEYIESAGIASRKHIETLEGVVNLSDKEYEDIQAKNKQLFDENQLKMKSSIKDSTKQFEENIIQRGNQSVEVISQAVDNSGQLIQKLESDINKSLDSLKDSLDLNPDIISFPEEQINADIEETAKKVRFNYETKAIMLSSELNRLTEEYSEKVNNKLKDESEKLQVNYKTTKDELLEIERQKTQELRIGAEKLQSTVSTFLNFLPDRMKEPIETLSEQTTKYNNDTLENLVNTTEKLKVGMKSHLDQQKISVENISKNLDDSYKFNTKILSDLQKETKNHFKISNESFNSAIEERMTQSNEKSRNEITQIQNEFKNKLENIETNIKDPMLKLESKIIPNIENSLLTYDKNLKKFNEDMISEISSYQEKYSKDFDTYLIKTEKDINKFMIEAVKKAEKLLVIIAPDISLLPDMIFKEEAIKPNIRIRILTSSIKSDQVQKLYRKKINIAIYETEEKIEDITIISTKALLKYSHTKDKRIWGMYTTRNEALLFYNNFLMNQAFKNVKMISRTIPTS